MARQHPRRYEGIPKIGAGKSTPLYDSLLDSEAFTGLSGSAVRVLLRVLRNYCRASKWGKEFIPEGFIVAYTPAWGISEGAFRTAIKELVDVGFLDAPHDIQERRIGTPRRYLMSSRWETYKASPDQQRALQGRSERQKTKQRRRADLMAAQKTFSKKNAPPKIGPYPDTKIVPYPDEKQSVETQKMGRIRGQKRPFSDTKNGPYVYIPCTPDESSSEFPSVSAESGRSSHFGPEMPENARDITTANTIPEVIAAIRVKIGDYAAPDLPELVERLGVKTTTAMLGPIFRNGHKAEKIVNILRGAACFENVLPHIPGEG